MMLRSNSFATEHTEKMSFFSKVSVGSVANDKEFKRIKHA